MSSLPDDNESEETPIVESETLDGFHEKQLSKIGFGYIQIIITIFAGLSNLSAMSIHLMIGLLSDFLLCEWDLKVSNSTAMNTSVFIGACFGSVIFGITSDKLSKIYSLIIANLFIVSFCFGTFIISSSHLTLMYICFFFIGFGSGGMMLVDSYLVDFVLFEKIGITTTLAHFFMNFANLVIPLCAYFTFYSLGWKYFMMSICVIYLITFVFALFLPESPKTYLHKYNKKAYVHLMEKLARYNGKQFIHDFGEDDFPSHNHIAVGDQFSFKVKLQIFIILVLFFLDGLVFQGFYLETNKIQHGFNEAKTNTTLGFEDDFNKCTPLTRSDLILQLSSAAGTKMGCIVMIFIINKIGRKKLLIFHISLFIILHLILLIHLELWVYAILISILRYLTFSITMVLMVFVVEFLPNTIKSRVLGIGLLCSFIGELSGSYITEFVFYISRNAMILTTTFEPVLLILLTLFLTEKKA